MFHTRRMRAGSLSFVPRADWWFHSDVPEGGGGALRPVLGRRLLPSCPGAPRPAFPLRHLPPQRPCTWTCLMSVADTYGAVVRMVRESALLLPVGCRVLWGFCPLYKFSQQLLFIPVLVSGTQLSPCESGQWFLVGDRTYAPPSLGWHSRRVPDETMRCAGDLPRCGQAGQHRPARRPPPDTLALASRWPLGPQARRVLRRETPFLLSCFVLSGALRPSFS